MNNTNEEYVQIAKRALKRACNTKLITIPYLPNPITIDDIVCCSYDTLGHDETKWYVNLAIPKITLDLYRVTNDGITYPDLYSITIIKNGYSEHLHS